MNGYPQVNYPHGGFGDAAQSNTMNPGYPYPFYDYGHYQPQALPHNFTTATYPTAPYSYIPQPPAQGDYWSEASQPAHFAAADVAPSYGQTPAPYQSQSWGNAPASTFGQGGASAATFASPAPQWQPLGLPPHAHANGYAQADTYQAQSGHWSQATAHMPTVASVQGLSMNMGVFSYEDVSPLLHAPPSLPPASQTGADVEPSVSSKPVSAKSGSGLGPVRRRKTTKRASPIVSKPITTKKSGKTMKAEFEMMPTWAKPQLEQHKCAKCSDGNIEPNNIPAHLFSKTHVQDLPRSLQDVIPFYVCRAFPRCTQMGGRWDRARTHQKTCEQYKEKYGDAKPTPRALMLLEIVRECFRAGKISTNPDADTMKDANLSDMVWTPRCTGTQETTVNTPPEEPSSPASSSMPSSDASGLSIARASSATTVNSSPVSLPAAAHAPHTLSPVTLPSTQYHATAPDVHAWREEVRDAVVTASSVPSSASNYLLPSPWDGVSQTI